MNAEFRAVAALMTIACLSPLANAQQRVSANETTTFTAADGAFRLSYPKDFQVCTQGKIEPCIHSYIPACHEDALVCVVYPAERFKDTSFGAASFQLREIFRMEKMTPDVCVTPYPRKVSATVFSGWPDFHVSAEHPLERISGLQFLHGIRGEGATGHWMSVDLYRAFHKQRCFELSVSQTGINPLLSDPPMKTLTPTQQKDLDETMSRILHSFRFSTKAGQPDDWREIAIALFSSWKFHQKWCMIYQST